MHCGNSLEYFMTIDTMTISYHKFCGINITVISLFLSGKGPAIIPALIQERIRPKALLLSNVREIIGYISVDHRALMPTLKCLIIIRAKYSINRLAAIVVSACVMKNRLHSTQSAVCDPLYLITFS